jgi:hypothetical protein
VTNAREKAIEAALDHDNTMPSKPSSHALANTTSRSAASASLNRISLTPRLLVVARFRYLKQAAVKRIQIGLSLCAASLTDQMSFLFTRRFSA